MEVRDNGKCVQETQHRRYPNVMASNILNQLSFSFSTKNLCVFVGCFSQPPCKRHYRVPPKGPPDNLTVKYVCPTVCWDSLLAPRPGGLSSLCLRPPVKERPTRGRDGEIHHLHPWLTSTPQSDPVLANISEHCWRELGQEQTRDTLQGDRNKEFVAYIFKLHEK